MKAALLVPSKFMHSREFGLGAVPANPMVTIEDSKLERQEGSKDDWGTEGMTKAQRQLLRESIIETLEAERDQ